MGAGLSTQRQDFASHLFFPLKALSQKECRACFKVRKYKVPSSPLQFESKKVKGMQTILLLTQEALFSNKSLNNLTQVRFFLVPALPKWWLFILERTRSKGSSISSHTRDLSQTEPLDAWFVRGKRKCSLTKRKQQGRFQPCLTVLYQMIF